MRFCVLQVGSSSAYTRDKYGDFGRLFVRLLAEPDEQWDIYLAAEGHYPDNPREYNGYVVTGSAADAHADEPWISKLNQFLRLIHEHTDAQLLGICFGHQTIANAFGGRTGRNPAGWEIGVHSLNLNRCELFYWPPELEHVNILEIHQDQVFDLPEGALNLASSEKTHCQIMAIGDRVLGIQGHPEFEKDIVGELVRTRMQAGIISGGLAQSCFGSLERESVERSFWRSMIRAFLTRRPLHNQ